MSQVYCTCDDIAKKYNELFGTSAMAVRGLWHTPCGIRNSQVRVPRKANRDVDGKLAKIADGIRKLVGEDLVDIWEDGSVLAFPDDVSGTYIGGPPNIVDVYRVTRRVT